MGCSHNCENCKESDCKERSFLVKTNEKNNIKNIIGVVSGKGGVGKSLVTTLLAKELAKKGFKVGILDADITGPSIPKAFGINDKASGMDDMILPCVSDLGIKIMSTNLILENDTDPVVWRGPIIAGTVKQFYTDTLWEELDYLLVDMPPGTGDVPLTVFQSLPINSIIIVSSPQELVSMIVSKAINMANMMNIKVLGLIENMSYFHCPDNNKDYNIFGESHIDEVANDFGLKVLAKLPIDSKIANMVDKGRIEELEDSYLDDVINELNK